MLRNPVYKGDHVVCKCHQKAIRSNTYNFVPRDEWEIIENCHEAIVSREQWDRVQKLINRRPTISGENRCPFYNLLDEAILNRLIDKIIISAAEVINGERVQKVRIVYNFVGEIAT